MKYVTISAENYDEAVQRARKEYGSSIRIHSRRDLTVRGGFLWLGKKSRVEITCYLPDASISFPWQKEEIVRDMVIQPEQQSIAEPEPIETEKIVEKELEAVEQPAINEVKVQNAYDHYVDQTSKILQLNGFSPWFSQRVMQSLQVELEHLSISDVPQEEFELMLIDKIISQISIDRELQLHPKRICVVMGPTGAGKTTTIAKMAALYGLQQREELKRNVKLVTIDTFRIGAYEQMASFSEALGIQAFKVMDEEDFTAILSDYEEKELILVDTIGRSPKDTELAIRMKSLLGVLKSEESAVLLALGATMKSKDLEKTIEAYAPFSLRAAIITKTDETDSIGEVLSVCAEHQIPLLFITDGQKVPKDIHKASAASILSLLQGFSLDFASLWATQIDVEDQS
ncbi:MAG: hypothetical protein WDA14_00755 [Sphaerochaetaceae bacterium]|jgi:flagellar biosynthesis protein FlhF|nr:hypothetical protein [Sphaerochaetaceae bacterium]NLO61256.1 hypothetical protein [Spirochaetales bacterium]